MELPKNITQIGETNQRCKIYVEDYVVSYMKQLNKVACDKDMAVALYGVRREEEETSYLFLYGACKLTFLQRETRHLSQAQQQEIERERTKYFPEYTFLGYRLLNGEMIEGMHVCEQGICRYISGYAQFYEKNDNMLAYMLDVREALRPEMIERTKYDAVKKKQEERRSRYEEKTHPESKHQHTAPAESSPGLRGMRVAVVALFAVLCMLGITTLHSSGDTDNLQVMARQVMNDIMTRKLPDAEPVEPTETIPTEVIVSETIAAETTPTQTTPAETASMQTTPAETTSAQTTSAETTPAQTASAQPTPAQTAPAQIVSDEATPENRSPEDMPAEVSTLVAEDKLTEALLQENRIAVSAEPASYIIKEGDTLIGISVRNYGSDSRVADICAMNQIQNPDDIKVGQKILLP